MSKKYRFLINYHLKNQPQSTEVETEVEALTPEQARFHVESLHTSELPLDITEVQISPITRPKQDATLGLQQ